MNKTEEIIKVAIEGDWMKPFIPKTQRAKDLWITLQSEPKAFKVAVCDPKFWQAIGKAKGWLNKTITVYDEIEEYNNPEELQEMINPAIEERMLIVYALEFHRINLTQSFDDAINYLYELIK